MKRIGRLIVSIFFVFVLFSFVSCKEPASSNTEIIPKPDTGIVPDEENQTPSLENKEMGFNVVLPGKNISRTVYYTKDDASYYTVVLKKEETVICSKNGNPGETLKFTVTEEGDYNFSVSAYDNKDSLIAEGVASKKITVADGYVLVKVTLNPKLKELDVNIDIEIDWNDDIENNSVKKMLISGFKVEGLDGSYDHTTVKLIAKHDIIAEGIIADETKKLRSGSAFVELANPYIYDAGDSKYFECYLEVEKSGTIIDRIQSFDKDDFSKIVNAKIPIVLSPIGTKDENLEKRMVNVVVNHGIGKFTFVEDEKVPERFSYTALPEMKWDDVVAADAAGTWAKIEKTAKADSEFATYKIIVNNLENDPDGMRYVVCGAIIGSTKATAGDHWNAWASNNADEGLISEVKNGSVEFNFVGKEPSWNEGKGTVIKIAAIDDPAESDPWLCLLTAPNNGNFNIPVDGDYTITIDAKAANAEKKFSAVKERIVKVYSFTLKSSRISEDAGAGYVAFCANWLPKNEWGATTPNKVAFNDVEVVGDVGTATIDLGGVELWAGEPNTFIDVEMWVLNPWNDAYFWDNRVMTSFKVHFDDEWIGKGVNIIYDLDNNVVTLEPNKIKVLGYKLVNISAEREGKTLYVHGYELSGQSQPGNQWGASTPHKGIVTDGEVTIEFAPENIWTLTDEANVQVIANHWDDIVVSNTDTDNFDSIPYGSECIIEIDCAAGTAKFVAN